MRTLSKLYSSLLFIFFISTPLFSQDHSTVEGAVAKAKVRLKGFKMPEGMKAYAFQREALK